ncbi:MAG: YbaB/EbfC family nucleoid-associated protein [Flavobacteriales bacterium]|nr:YbaB/EbfC family nucleoid-associated protein [Flavobacteriales bacterium]
MMKKLQAAKAEMDKIKARLETIAVEGVSPEGKVKVTCNGNRVIKGIEVVDTTILTDKKMLEDCTLMATNDALNKAEKVNETEMKSAASSMMPGMGNMFG